MEVRKKKRGVSTPGILSLMIMTAVIAGGLIYIWHNYQITGQINENKTLTQNLNNSKAENTKLKNQISALEKNTPSKSLRENVQNRADIVLHTLKNGNMSDLAAFVHPDKGVRFSPYPHIDLHKDVVVKASALIGIMTDTKLVDWGIYDGSGAPINLTFEQYYKKFVYDVNFLEAPQIVFNEAIKRGTMINNVKELYPGDSLVEYYFPGFEAKYAGVDWRSLILVFEQKNNIWYLVGIVHGQWTT